LLELLAPRSGECILDLGCGTSHLTYKIASGAEVLGIDSANNHDQQARKNYPHLDFEVADGKICTLQNNLMQSSRMLYSIGLKNLKSCGWRSLRQGRRLAEFGGKGNVKAIVTAIYNAMQAAGYPANALNPWYFPSIGEYGTLLEKQGFQLTCNF